MFQLLYIALLIHSRMKKFIIAGITILSAFAITSCKYDNEEDLYPDNTPCDTTVDVTYSQFVQPLIEQQCYECHSDANYVASGGGIPLEGYTNVADQVAIGSFIGSIKHDPNYEAMPDGKPKLDNCTILKLDKWIAEGALDN